jgi:hypothetical protein
MGDFDIARISCQEAGSEEARRDFRKAYGRDVEDFTRVERL